MPGKGKLTIANLDPDKQDPHTGWLLVNVENGRCYYCRTKELAIAEARKYKKDYGGVWEVKPTYDPGPYTKPGAEKERVG